MNGICYFTLGLHRDEPMATAFRERRVLQDTLNVTTLAEADPAKLRNLNVSPLNPYALGLPEGIVTALLLEPRKPLLAGKEVLERLAEIHEFLLLGLAVSLLEKLKAFGLLRLPKLGSQFLVAQDPSVPFKPVDLKR